MCVLVHGCRCWSHCSVSAFCLFVSAFVFLRVMRVRVDFPLCFLGMRHMLVLVRGAVVRGVSRLCQLSVSMLVHVSGNVHIQGCVFVFKSVRVGVQGVCVFVFKGVFVRVCSSVSVRVSEGVCAMRGTLQQAWHPCGLRNHRDR